MCDRHDRRLLKNPTSAVLTANPTRMKAKIRLPTCRLLEQSLHSCQQFIQTLCGIGAVFLLTGSFTGWSATFYVAKTGSDSNPGTQASPWLTLSRASTTIAAGDTVKVGAGLWQETLDTAVAGTAGSRVTWDGQGVAKVNLVSIDKPYNTFQNFEVAEYTNGYWCYLVQVKVGGDHTVISNCFIHSPALPDGSPKVPWQGGVEIAQGSGSPFDTSAPSNCEVVSNFFSTLSGEYAAFSTGGTNNLFQGNVVTNLYRGNCVYLFGKYNKIIRNYFHDTAKIDPVRGEEFYRSHPDFVQYFGQSGRGSVGHVIDGNIVSEASALSQLTRSNGVDDPLASDAVTGALHGGWTIRNNLFLNLRQTASAALPNMKWLNNVFYRCNYDAGHAISAINSATGLSEGVVILNNAFIDCGLVSASNQCWYAIGGAEGVTLTNWTADYNFVAKNNWGPAMTAAAPTGYRFKETHMLNGGNPSFAPGTYIPMLGSILIDAGTSLTGMVDNDKDGWSRPVGSGYDVGAYEFDRLRSDGSPNKPPTPGGLHVVKR